MPLKKDTPGGQPLRRRYKKWKPAEGDDPEQTGSIGLDLMAAISGNVGTDMRLSWCCIATSSPSG